MRVLTLVIALLVLALGAGFYSGFGQDPVPKVKPKTKKELMKRKLVLGQELLASLTLNELDKAAAQAEELLALPRDPAWKMVKTEAYQGYISDFKRATQGIIQASKDRNLEAAKLNYLGLTMTCFHCHAYVRDGKVDI
jgi:hypothetical protein